MDDTLNSQQHSLSSGFFNVEHTPMLTITNQAPVYAPPSTLPTNTNEQREIQELGTLANQHKIRLTTAKPQGFVPPLPPSQQQRHFPSPKPKPNLKINIDDDMEDDDASVSDLSGAEDDEGGTDEEEGDDDEEGDEEEESVLSSESEKMDLLMKLDELRNSGHIVRTFDLNNRLIEIKKEVHRIKHSVELNASIKFQQKMLMACVTGIEFLNKRYDPFDISLDGWSENVFENVDDFRTIFEKLYEKYKSRAEMAPEIELLLALAGSAFMFNLSNSLFKNISSSVHGQMKNLRKTIKTAFNESTLNPEQQQQQQQQQYSPPPQQSQMPNLGGLNLSSLMQNLSNLVQPPPPSHRQPVPEPFQQRASPPHYPPVQPHPSTYSAPVSNHEQPSTNYAHPLLNSGKHVPPTVPPRLVPEMTAFGPSPPKQMNSEQLRQSQINMFRNETEANDDNDRFSIASSSSSIVEPSKRSQNNKGRGGSARVVTGRGRGRGRGGIASNSKLNTGLSNGGREIVL
uniref:Uncharacterized protein n=1 Tax=viral metagenome TaxID=1070528 RepID=A0A6C0CSN6_9ZZZZ